ncbi:cold shock domain-containing protein 3-like [Tripterygium wilfordii]|uniref:Cold shock domain-containing protein 3-like n=2 Tax=Tripterygium wilfordii TaxID=458696 RepID=A0A7J7CVJ1_TRIWF|nr:cold shock domain-containing protein 3-like [Tripterygium wilfordii]
MHPNQKRFRASTLHSRVVISSLLIRSPFVGKRSRSAMAQQEERSTGTVQWFNDSKGFGFIKPDDGGEDLFVHHSSIKADGFRKLFEGDSVEFQILLGPEGKTQAIDVTIEKNAGGRSGGGWRGNDRRSNGTGYGGGAGGAGCYNCGDPNHLARDCSRGSNSGGGGGSCYNCGGRGHFARDCIVGNNDGGKSCYNCGEYGHMARDCSNIGGGDGNTSGGCYNCGEHGHLARECRNTGGSGGRFERERERGFGGGGGGCYNCGKPGHFARECTTS